MNNFEKALAIVLKFEGGYVFHKLDPGGATNKGIIQRTYSQYRRDHELPYRSVRDIQDHEVEDIYYQYYWLPSKAGTMHRPLGLVHFDSAVNFGVTGSVKLLQETLGLTPDGDWGPNTDKVFKANNNTKTALAYCEQRKDARYARVRRKPNQSVFLKGWLNRDNHLKAEIEHGY